MVKVPITSYIYYINKIDFLINKKSKEYKSNLVLRKELKEIMIGLLLGDGNMQTFFETGKTWRLRIL